jgi:hypothetical protein
MSYESTVLSYNPYAYWPLDETSGTIAHDIAHGYNGTIGPAVTLGNSAIMPYSSTSMYFTEPNPPVGAGTVTISLPAIPTAVGLNSNVFSTSDQRTPWIIFWFKGSITSGNGCVIQFNNFSLTINGGAFAGLLPTGNTMYITTPNLYDNVGHFIAVQCTVEANASLITFGGTVYIDGVLQTVTSSAVSRGGANEPINPWLQSHVGAIGETSTNTQGLTNTYISHLALLPYNAITSATDVQKIMNAAAGTIGFDALPNWLIEIPRTDYVKLAQGATCPMPTAITIFEGSNSSVDNSSALSVPGRPSFESGYYYLMPVGTSQLNGQPLPKYFSQLTQPYSAILYPPGDMYAGKMLVKNSVTLTSLPGDVTSLTASAAATEVQRVFLTLFAF